MNNKTRQAIVCFKSLVLLLLINCYTGTKQKEEQNFKTVVLKDEYKVSALDLKRLYESATSEQERRAVCLRAIDEEIVSRTEPISVVDTIFGSRLDEDRPKKEGQMHSRHIAFNSKPIGKGNHDRPGWVRDGRWYLEVQYDWNGDIQNYRLSNFNKDLKLVKESQEATISELKRLYESAKSEYERRAVCLRAIDEGLISYHRQVSLIDSIFGTHLAAESSKIEEQFRWGRLTLGTEFPPSYDERGWPMAGGFKGWHLDVKYDRKNVIQEYFLNNLHK